MNRESFRIDETEETSDTERRNGNLDSMDLEECRICRSGPENGPLVRACRCTAFVHARCLQHWLESRPGGLPRDLQGHIVASQLACEVCNGQYSVRIESRVDFSRLFSIRSLEAYFEGLSLVLTFCLLCTTSWMVWSAAAPKERMLLQENAALVGLVSGSTATLALAALWKVFARARRVYACVCVCV
mmetsp:Transcript_19345/g.53716  ORF Transcript_19345/g.53716 Transcript_19345/m.53716 type:complete len:187 (+) Transcript_19345:67-627(+)